MKIPTDLEQLLSAVPHSVAGSIAEHWTTPEGTVEWPDEMTLYGLVEDCTFNERTILFNVYDYGGSASEAELKQRLVPDEELPALPIDGLRRRGLLFKIAIGAELESYVVIPEEFRAGLYRYRHQFLVMQIAALIEEFEDGAMNIEPLEMPRQIQPQVALSHLLAVGDPDGFRYPLTRAFAIPESFPASARNALRSILHELYVLFLSYMGLLRPDRAYTLETLSTLVAAVAALLSHHYAPQIEAEYLHEDRRPFAAPQVLLATGRRPFWRSFVVLFLEQFLTPIGATCPIAEGRFQVHPDAFGDLDLEVRRAGWINECLAEWGIEVR